MAGKHQICANPASAWKLAFCKFLPFFTSPYLIGWTYFIKYAMFHHTLLQSTHMRWFKVTTFKIKVISHPDRGQMQEGRLLYHQTWRSQTSCIAGQAMHKWGYALPKIQVYARNKHTNGKKMDVSMPQNAQNCEMESRTTLLDCRRVCYFVHIPWWPPTSALWC